MRPTTRDPRGGVRGRGATLGLATMLPGLILVVVIFWALAAVLMLTGTLINAREIEDTVEVINGEVSPIDEELNNVKVLENVTRSTVKIRAAAEPLSGQADDILTAARAIDRSARSILGTAGSINETAKSINGTVTSINSTVNSIGSTVVSINGTVNQIGGRVGSINRLVGSILGFVGPSGARDATSIKASVNRILGDLRDIDRDTRSIDPGVAAINRRAIRAIGVVRGIDDDFDGIRSNVGGTSHGSAGNAGIHGHANSIDCAALIGFVGPTQYCGR